MVEHELDLLKSIDRLIIRLLVAALQFGRTTKLQRNWHHLRFRTSNSSTKMKQQWFKWRARRIRDHYIRTTCVGLCLHNKSKQNERFLFSFFSIQLVQRMRLHLKATRANKMIAVLADGKTHTHAAIAINRKIADFKLELHNDESKRRRNRTSCDHQFRRYYCRWRCK